MSDGVLFQKGYEIQGPNGQGYRLKRDVHIAEVVMPDQFEAFGGAPEPEAGAAMPVWLAERLGWTMGAG